MPRPYESDIGPDGHRMEYWIDIVSDDLAHGITVYQHRFLGDATRDYERLIAGRPQMRIVLRKFWHIHRSYIPARLVPLRGWRETNTDSGEYDQSRSQIRR